MRRASASAAMPRAVKVGPHRYTLTVDDAAIVERMDVTGESIGALTSLDGLKMYFASASALPHIVLHEVLHAAFNLSGLNIRLGTEREEDVIQSLDHLLLGVLRDNPALVKYLTET